MATTSILKIDVSAGVLCTSVLTKNPDGFPNKLCGRPATYDVEGIPRCEHCYKENK